jgi:hypothetical protein
MTAIINRVNSHALKRFIGVLLIHLNAPIPKKDRQRLSQGLNNQAVWKSGRVRGGGVGGSQESLGKSEGEDK